MEENQPSSSASGGEEQKVPEMPPVEETTQNIEISTEGSKEVKIKPTKAKKSPPPVITVDFIRSISPIALTKSEVDRSVFVRNISINATLKAVYDFFLFFGKIQKIFLHLDVREKLGKQISIVVFEKQESFDTCLMLNNVVLVDQPIEVHSLRTCLKKKKKKASKPTGKQQQVRRVKQQVKQVREDADESGGEPGVRKSISNLFSAGLFAGESVIRSMRNSVSGLDERVRETVKGVDEAVGVTKTVKNLGDGTKKTIEKVDTSLGVSKRAKELTDQTSKGFNVARAYTQMQITKIDERLGVTKNAKVVGESVTERTKKSLEGLTALGGRVKHKLLPGLGSQYDGGEIPVMLPTDATDELPGSGQPSQQKEEEDQLAQKIQENLQPEAPKVKQEEVKSEDDGMQSIPLSPAKPVKKKEEEEKEGDGPPKAEDIPKVDVVEPKKEEKEGEIDLLLFSPENVGKDEKKKEEDILKFN